MSLSIKERIDRQLGKAGISMAPECCPRGEPHEPASSVNERIAKQLHRAKVDAAVAALRTPPPDYVFKEPVMPRRQFTGEEIVRAFAEDRVYDDVPSGKAKFDVGQVKDTGRVRDILFQENPAEFVVVDEKQMAAGGKNFRTIGQTALECDGYSMMRPKPASDTVEHEPEPVPRTDLFNNIAAGLQDGAAAGLAQAQPQPTKKSVPPLDVPNGPAISGADEDGVTKIELTDIQRQMLAMMRKQRKL